MTNAEREHVRRQIDKHIRQGNAFQNVCAECLEPLKTPPTARNKFCGRKCNSAYYWREHKAKRLQNSGLSRSGQGRSHQVLPSGTTAGSSLGTDSCPVPTAPKNLETGDDRVAVVSSGGGA
jgi:hypothetical protein